MWPLQDGNFEFSGGNPGSNFKPLKVKSYDTYLILIFASEYNVVATLATLIVASECNVMATLATLISDLPRLIR